MRCFTKVLTVSCCLFFASLLGAPTATAADAKPAASAQETATERYGDLPLSFEANQGQTDGQVRFLSRGSGYSFFLTQSGAVLSFAGDAHAASVLRMQLAGASPTAHIEGLDELPGKSNYFAGSDSSRWHTGVSTFSRVKYENIYPGISLIYYGNQSQLEYDFVVAPGAEPRQIHLSIAGAQELSVDAQGNLVLQNSAGEVQLLAPKVYQRINGQNKKISGQWSLAANRTASFHLGKYDRTQPLVIDPVLMYSSFLGGSQRNAVSKITLDDAGNAYVAGYTASGDFPAAPTPLATTFGAGAQSRGAFVAKIDSSGSNLLYTTYLSGSADEEATGLAVDKSGNVYVAGNTHSIDFPTRNALQSKCATANPAGTCSNAFLTKISPTGDSILFSTYLGGSGGESARGLFVDAKGSAYLAGITSSSDFPVTAGAAQAKCGGACQQNAFVAKFSPSGDKLVYATFVGGSDFDDAADLAVDSTGNAYLAGHTTSRDFPLATPYQKSCAADSASASKACAATAFVTKIAADGSAFTYSTYLGGSLGSKATAIAIDAQGSAYVTGSTQSPDFPVAKAFQKSCGLDVASGKCSIDAFLTKFTPTGKALVYSTYLGGTGRDEASGIAVDPAGNVHVVGRTESPDFPTAKPVQARLKGSSDAFAARFNPAGSALTFSTYHGGTATESGSSIALDAKGNLYLAGETTSTDFPTQHPFQSSCAGSCTSAFITKMALPPPVPTPAWTIAKNHTTDPFIEGDTGSTYTISVQNSGTGPTDGTVVTVVDTIPAGLTATNLTGTGWTCVTATATCTRTDVLAAAASYPDITLTVTVAKTAAASVTNSVQVSGGGAASAANTTDLTNVIFPLGITKTDSGDFIQGRTGVTYTIAGMKNNGNTATTGTVTVVDTLPAGITATGMSGTGWACVTATTTCTRGNALAAGASYPSITLTVDVANNAAASVINSVTISEAGFTLTTTTTDTTTVLPIPVLSISKTHSAPFSQGGTGVWTIKVGNTAAATSLTYGTLTVTDTLPSGAGYTYTLASGTGTNWTCGTAGTTTITVTCTDSTDAVSGGSNFPDLLLTVNVPGTSPATVSNTATASGGGAAASKSNTDANVPVTQVPNSLTKGTGDNQSVPVGNDYAAYSVTVKDAANVPIQNVQVTFTAGSGPGNATCFFAGSSTTMVPSDASGVATTVTPCKANAVAAGYNVQASVTTAGVNKPNFANNNTDFSLAFNPTFADVAPGAAPAGVTIKASPVNGYAPTSLTVTSCLPIAGPAPQPTCSITSPITVGTAAPVSFSTTGSPAGTYTLQAKIHDSSNFPVIHTKDFTLHIVTVVVAPKPSTIEVNQTTDFFGTVTGLADPSVNWSLSCGSGCGSLNPTTTADAVSPTTYTSPTSVVANSVSETLPTVTITGAANGDPNFSDNTGPIQITDFAVVVPPSNPVLTITQSVTGMSQASAFPINAYVPPTIPTVTCVVTATTAFTGGPTCSTGPLNVGANPTPTTVSIPTGTVSASAPVGLYTATVTGTDAVGVAHSASRLFSVQCTLSLEQTAPTFTPALTTAPNTTTPNRFTIGVSVAQNGGGSACPYGSVPVVGSATPTDASGDGTIVTAQIVSGQNGTLASGGSSGIVTFEMTGAPGNNGKVNVPEFDAGQSSNIRTLSMPVGFEAPVQESVVKGGTISPFPLPVTLPQATGNTVVIPTASGSSSVCGVVDSTGASDSANFGINCSATFSGGTVNLSVTLPASNSASAAHDRGTPAMLSALAVGFPAIVFLSVGASAFAPRRRKRGLSRITSIFGILLLLSLLVVLPACGGGFNAVIQNQNPNTFTLTVMGYVTDGTNVLGVDVFTVPLTIN